MFLYTLCVQRYKKAPKLAIPKNGDAAVYQLLSIARNFKTPYLCSRNRKGVVMIATPERWAESATKSRPQPDIHAFFFFRNLYMMKQTDSLKRSSISYVLLLGLEPSMMSQQKIELNKDNNKNKTRNRNEQFKNWTFVCRIGCWYGKC